MHLLRASARRIAGAVLPLGLLMVAGCTGPGADASQSSSSPAAADRITAGIEDELSSRDDVADVDVYYQDSVTIPESASADITMRPGADPQAISDEAVRLIWLSRLNPLSTIDVSVINPDEPIKGVSTSLNLQQDADRASLESRYGPHPK